MNKIVLSIEWDMESEEFVVKQPSPNFLGHAFTRRISLTNFKMLPPDSSDQLCVYYDAHTGQKF